MIRKLAIAILFLTGLAGFWYGGGRPGKGASVHIERKCRESMRILEGAFEMYDMDSNGIVFNHDGPVSEYAEMIVARRYLKAFPVCRYGNGTYYITGTPETTEISCTLHGTARDYRFDETFCTWKGKGKELVEAVSVGNWELADRLIREGTSVNSFNENGYTVLHWAVYRNLAGICGYLLKNGADPFIWSATDRGDTPFHLAAIHGSKSVMDAMIAAVGPHRASQLVNATDSSGRTALHYIATNRDEKYVFECLLQHGARLEARDINGMTPLHHGAAEIPGNMCQALLEAGADIEARDGHGRTPLHHAAGKYGGECYRILLEFGANPDASDDSGLTPRVLNSSLEAMEEKRPSPGRDRI